MKLLAPIGRMEELCQAAALCVCIVIGQVARFTSSEVDVWLLVPLKCATAVHGAHLCRSRTWEYLICFHNNLMSLRIIR
jgi:hypothetical protein